MTRVVAVRHGETDWNRTGRMQGWAPVELNATGREQATAAGEWLAAEYDVDRVVTSDLPRARETADHVTAAVDAPMTETPAWRERDLGVYQGLPHDEVAARFPEFGLDETAYRAADRTPESGESLREMADRVTAAFDGLEGDGTVLVVAHGGPLCALLGHVRGMSLPAALSAHHLDNCGVSEFDAGGDGETRVVSENVTAWRGG